MTTVWLDLLQNAHHNIDCDASDLKNIAKLLRRVGMDGLADEISDVAYSLTKSASDINKALDLKTTADVKGAYAMTGTILNTLVEKCKGDKKS
jgi:hypothetical protein